MFLLILILILMILLLPIFNSKENFIYYRIPFKTKTKQKKIFFLKDKIPKIVFQSYKTRDLPYSYRSTHKNMIDKNAQINQKNIRCRANSGYSKDKLFF